jgi:hypothetical protein
VSFKAEYVEIKGLCLSLELSLGEVLGWSLLKLKVFGQTSISE